MLEPRARKSSAKRRVCVAFAASRVVEFPRNADDSLTTRPAAGVNVRRMKTPQTIGVIGAGTMGAGIAQACVVAGLPVVMIDVDTQRIARARTAISSGVERALSKGSARPPANAAAALDRLRGTTDYDALSDCDFVIEAATENESLKISHPAAHRCRRARRCHRRHQHLVDLDRQARGEL